MKNTSSTNPPGPNHVLYLIFVVPACDINVTTIGTPILLTTCANPIFNAIPDCSLLDIY